MPSHRASLLVAVVALAGAATAGPAAAADTLRFQARTGHASVLTGSGAVPIGGATGQKATLRIRLTLPASWRPAGAAKGPRVTYRTSSSCGHRVTFVAQMLVGPDAPAAQRAAALTPVAAPNLVMTSGTRDRSAFRVGRTRGTATVTGAFVQPLAMAYSGPVPAGSRLFAEVVATATADPRRECHAGGPRSVARALGDAFGSGSLGGFALTR